MNNHLMSRLEAERETDTEGLRFYIPQKYLDHITDTNNALKRIESILETIVATPVSAGTGSVFLAPKSKALLVKKEIEEENIQVPFLSLRITNSPDFYKVSRTFLSDIEEGKKHFGFQRLINGLEETFIFVIASFVSYTMNNQPALVVVEDFEKKEWAKIKKNFAIGSIFGCRCYDWGNITVIDKKNLLLIKKNEYKNTFDMLKNDFKMTFWSVGPEGLSEDYLGFSYFLLDTLSSMTIVVEKNKAKISNVVKVKEHYDSYKIPTKGLLNGKKAEDRNKWEK